jgi:hypothetical protein
MHQRNFGSEDFLPTVRALPIKNKKDHPATPDTIASSESSGSASGRLA